MDLGRWLELAPILPPLLSCHSRLLPSFLPPLFRSLSSCNPASLDPTPFLTPVGHLIYSSSSLHPPSPRAPSLPPASMLPSFPLSQNLHLTNIPSRTTTDLSFFYPTGKSVLHTPIVLTSPTLLLTVCNLASTNDLLTANPKGLCSVLLLTLSVVFDDVDQISPMESFSSALPLSAGVHQLSDLLFSYPR